MNESGKEKKCKNVERKKRIQGERKKEIGNGRKERKER